MLQFLTNTQAELTLFFLGSTFILLIFTIQQWVQIRDRSLLIYAASCVIFLLYFTRNTDWIHPLCAFWEIEETLLWRYTENTLGLCMCASYILFTYYFLGYEKHFSRRTLLPAWIFVVSFAVLIGLDWYLLFLRNGLEGSLELQQYAQLIILPAHAYMIFLGLKLKNIVSRIIISGYFLHMVFFTAFLTAIGAAYPSSAIFPPAAVPSPEYRIVLLGMQLSLFLENLFFLYAFVYRIRIFQNERDKAYRELWLKQQEARHLKELEAQKGRFFTNISHEFRTPLTAILGSAGQLAGNGKQQQRIERNARQLLRMVNQILELAKLQDGKLRPRWVQADVIAFLKYLADPFRSLAIARKQTFVFHSDIPALRMDYDPDMLQSVFSNLVGNALKFTPEYGEVKALAGREEEELILKVIDNGPGMPPEVSARIFDRFYSLPPTPSKGGGVGPRVTAPHEHTSPPSGGLGGAGSGIGLSLVRELTALLGGEVSVNSRPGAGTTFTVRLPIHREAPAEDIPRPDIAREVMPQPGRLTDNGKGQAVQGRPTILIVEDNPDLIAYLQEILEERYTTYYARNGREALEVLAQTPIALVLCDLMMPEMDGLELCRTIREERQYRHLPVAMVTAKATPADKMQGLAAGADAYLEKPFRREELLLRIDNLLRAYGLPEANGKEEEMTAFLKKLDAAIEANLDNEIFNVNHLCRALHLARPTLNKKVKAATGLPPGEYLRQKRLKHARRLLETTDMPVSEVAQEVGFKTPAHFSSAFKEAYGVTPSQARK